MTHLATVKPNTNSVVAHLPGVRREVRAELERRADLVRAAVAAHVQTGDLARSLTVEVSAPDATVSIADPSILAINYGHIAPDGTPVAGLHLIEAAL
ncbi:DUF5403 family protein [Kitasatospora sp. NBC_00070]|uniref:DUF5403 family protein n=1 Tax=Kitasatospora sp. NBC_00070 TaxID=2975962 RepID=UPI0032522227